MEGLNMAKVTLAMLVLLHLLIGDVPAVSGLIHSTGVDQNGVKKLPSSQKWISEFYGRKMGEGWLRRSLRAYKKLPPPSPIAGLRKSHRPRVLPPPPLANKRSVMLYYSPPPPAMH
ncbi:hypothetical protein SAY87_010659 [Trapa incisa]|uniref:Uncharacterized protein n=1 Tax=Trapa incisa TaxID=236973 RepID=A0AAN7GQR9_9MYRT|nr:hypothetical protein SAY87_010659 [Trapa incisa]